MSETPQRHTHAGPGDGGSINFDSRVNHPVEIIGTATESPSDGGFMEVDTGVGANEGDGIGVSVTIAEDDPADESIASQLVETTGEVGLQQEIFWNSTDGEYKVSVYNNTGSQVSIRVVVYRISVPSGATTLDSRLQV